MGEIPRRPFQRKNLDSSLHDSDSSGSNLDSSADDFGSSGIHSCGDSSASWSMRSVPVSADLSAPRVAGDSLGRPPGDPLAAADASFLENPGGFSLPLQPPEWFKDIHLVAFDRGRWLCRGRDQVDGMPVAMKIVELPAGVQAGDAERLLQACKESAEIVNPNSIAPRSCVIQERYLAIIRPWINGNRWRRGQEVTVSESLKRLSALAYAIQASHDKKIAHGGIHPRNIITAHTGSVQLVDSVVNGAAIDRWFSGAGVIPPARQRHLDVCDLIDLVAIVSVRLPEKHGEEICKRCRLLAKSAANTDDACGLIGDDLMSRVNEVASGPLDDAQSLQSSLKFNLQSVLQRVRSWWK